MLDINYVNRFFQLRKNSDTDGFLIFRNLCSLQINLRYVIVIVIQKLLNFAVTHLIK